MYMKQFMLTMCEVRILILQEFKDSLDRKKKH